MSFYPTLAPWYDRIFPVDPDTVDLLAGLLPQHGRALDLACGTGGHALALARRGHAVAASDLDAAMIALARRAFAASGIPADLATLDLRDAPKAYAGERFDLVYCIGNSLVHLTGAGEIAALLSGLRPLVAPGGALVLQILHYDRILDRDIRALPPISPPGVSFLRFYEPAGDLLRFRTELSVDGEPPRRGEVPLRPLRFGELTGALAAAGFRAEARYGDFDRSPVTADARCVVTIDRA